MKRSRILYLCALLAAFGLAQGSLRPDEGGEKVTLEEVKSEVGDAYHILGSFDVPVVKDQVWGVLTDYNALKGVVSSMLDSRVIERQGSRVLVSQVALGKFLFFRKSIALTLAVDENPKDALSFSETGKKNFRLYNGGWRLEESAGGVRVHYELNVSSADMAPAFLEKNLFRDNALGLLKELKAEILHRAALQANLTKKDLKS